MLRSVKLILKENPVYFVSGATVSGLVLLEVVDHFDMHGYGIEAGYHKECANQ
jgi:hypothetical protein